MHSPYTPYFLDAFLAAQTCIALALTALVLFWRWGSWLSRGSMLAAVWIASIAVAIAALARGVGMQVTDDATRHLLGVAAGLATLSVATARRPILALVALAGEVGLWFVSDYVKDSDTDLCALHVAWFSVLVGLLRPHPPRRGETIAPAAPRSHLGADAILFVIAAALASVVCVLVLKRAEGSADEWAYTYQAAVFAKGRAYAHSPRCQPYLQNFYVFESMGRLFSQYTPGWSLFLAPFFLVGATWLGGPVAMGLLAVGVARVARTAVRTSVRRGESSPSDRTVAAAGVIAGLLASCGTTFLLNGASRFSHVLVAATYAWSLDALLAIALPLPPRRQWRAGVVLGCATALLLATRPADGATLGTGMFLVFLWSLVRRRVGWRSIAGAAIAFAFWGGLTLVILRLQIGQWFVTGYSLEEVIHPWNKVAYSMPKPNEWKWGAPLATGTYCWWPCSIAVGAAGLASLRGRALGLVAAIGIGIVPFEILYSWIELGRGWDWGYGPRYVLPLVVPMAAGGGVALAPLWCAARERASAGRSALAAGGPMAIVVVAVAMGLARIAPLLYPTASEHTRAHSALTLRIAELGLRNAIVMAEPRTTGFDSKDLTKNLPIDLYPNQPAIIAVDNSPEAARCLATAFPGRRMYRASGVGTIDIVPY